MRGNRRGTAARRNAAALQFNGHRRIWHADSEKQNRALSRMAGRFILNPIVHTIFVVRLVKMV